MFDGEVVKKIPFKKTLDIENFWLGQCPRQSPSQSTNQS